MKTQLTTAKPVHLDIKLKPGVWIDPSKFVKVIADAGYQARQNEVTITMTGKLIKDNDLLLFTMDDINPKPQSFLLAKGSGKTSQETQALEAVYDSANEKLGQVIEIEALWRAPTDKKDPTALPVLIIKRIAEIKSVEAGKSDR